MSRSNPSDNAVNPSTRWFEWDGANGQLRFYDKTEKTNVVVDDKFTFLVLDELAAVKGWHDPSESGIFSNEVRDTKQDVMVVRSFKGGDLATGVYSAIRDRAKAMGGHFVASVYIAFKRDGKLAIGNIQFKGAALNAWVEFKKAHRADLYKSAVFISGKEEGKKGKVTFFTPTFSLQNVSEQTNAEAVALDGELQGFLSAYLSRPKAEQALPKPNTYEQLLGSDEDRMADSHVEREVEELY